LVSLVLTYPMLLGRRELAHWQSTGFRITEDHGISTLFQIACNRWGSDFVSCVHFFREFVEFRERFVVLS